ncbi:MAG: hypothetical protein HOV79_26020 [Hamadaea sp.]|nr:hypothetical protein [Hamadaea sp.]
MTVRAWWSPGWYNLDKPLKAGERDIYGFYRSGDPAGHGPLPVFDPHPEKVFRTKPGFDLLFANSTGRAWDYRYVTIETIEHARFGPVDEVDTRSFGQYTFRFADGRWVTIEAEQGPGNVNAASPDFPVGDCDPAWADEEGWALVVTLSDIVQASHEDL